MAHCGVTTHSATLPGPIHDHPLAALYTQPVAHHISFQNTHRRPKAISAASTLFAALCIRTIVLPLVISLLFSDEAFLVPEATNNCDEEDLTDDSIKPCYGEPPKDSDYTTPIIVVDSPPTRESSVSPVNASPRPPASYSAARIHDRSSAIGLFDTALPLPPMVTLDSSISYNDAFTSRNLIVDRHKSIQRQESVRSALGIETIPSGYDYTPFQSGSAFRLLKLSPRTDVEGRMVCSLVEYGLQDGNRPAYKALSYTWGDTQERLPIMINGELAHITSNLHGALATLRRSGDERALWIDALCINQADPTERNHQVSQMREIFSSADEIVAWIGHPGEDSRVVMSIMKRGWASVETHTSNLGRGSEEFESYSAQLREANRRFFQREYWTRAWIIQELVVAKEVLLLCGEDVVRWSKFENYVMSFRDHGSKVMGRPPEELRKGINERMKLLMLKARYQEQQHDLLTLISASTSALATDPRDKIFALLGLIGRGAALQLEPDYTLSPCSVYCQAIQYMYKDEFKGDNRGRRRVEAIKLREYFRKECSHNPFDRNISILSHDCDGMDCGTKDFCFRMPSLLGKTGIHVLPQFFQYQIPARSTPLR